MKCLIHCIPQKIRVRSRSTKAYLKVCSLPIFRAAPPQIFVGGGATSELMFRYAPTARSRENETRGKTGVTADRDKIEFRLFNSKLNLVTVGRDSSFPYSKWSSGYKTKSSMVKVDVSFQMSLMNRNL